MLRNTLFLFTIMILIEGYPALSHGDTSALIKEFREYEGSKYLVRHLEIRSPVLKPERDALYKEFERSRKEFSGRKKERAEALKQAIYRNSYYPVSKEFYEKVDALETEKERERFLFDGYSLKNLYAVALTNSPEISEAYMKAKAALEKFDQVTGLDTILSQYAFFTRDLNIKIGKPGHKKPQNLNFPFPGMLTLKGSIADEEVLLSRLKLKKTVQEVLSKVNRVFYELNYIYDAIEITGETVLLLERLKHVIHTLYTTGKSTLNAALIIDMEIDKLKTSIWEKEDKARAVQVRINKLVNISLLFSPENEYSQEPVYLNYDRDRMVSLTLKERIEIKILKRELKKKKLMIELSEKRFYPDFTPGYSFFQNRPLSQIGTSAGQPPFSTRPFIRGGNWFGNNDAFIREMKTGYQSLKERLKNLENRSIDELVQAEYRYQNSLRSYRLYEDKLVPKSAMSVGITEALYSTGGVDFLELIDSQTRYLRYKLKLREAVRDSYIEAGRMERIAGARVLRKGEMKGTESE